MKKKYWLYLMLLGLLGCSAGPAEIVDAQNRNMPAAVGRTAEKTVGSPVRAVGRFADVKTDGEHQSGFTVELWKQDDRLLGLISGQRDLKLIGDPPTGVLEDVRYDPATRKLSFRARLSVGVVDDREKGTVPTRDLYEFSGVLGETSLRGELIVTDELCPDKCRDRIELVLARTEAGAPLSDYADLSGWQADADDILKRRGPKW